MLIHRCLVPLNDFLVKVEYFAEADFSKTHSSGSASLHCVVLTFFLVSLIPGSVATALIGTSGTKALYARVERQLGLNQPVYVQYWRWLVKAFHGNLGSSLQNKQPVVEMLNSRLTVTLTLILATVLVVSLVGVALGIVSAVKTGILNRFIDLLSWLGLAMPNFWLGLVLVTTFS